MCDSFCGQNVDLDREEGAGGPTITRSLSHVRSFAMSVSARSLVWRERERESKLEKAAEEICSSGRPLFVFFRCTARWWPVKNELFFINGVDGTSGELFLTITFRVSSVKSRFYFLVVCLFFPHSRVDFQKKIGRET